MYLLINDEYGQEIAAVQYDKEKEKLKDVFDAARVKYPHNAFCVSSSSATMPEPAAPELTDDEKKARALKELDNQYDADKAELSRYYVEAALSGNTDALTDIKAEFDELTSEYDKNRAEIEGE